MNEIETTTEVERSASPSSETTARPLLRCFLPAATVALFALGFFLLAATGVDWATWTAQLPREWLVIFWPAMILLPLIGFPISAFYVAAALLFPLWVACILGPISLAINMALGYWLGHTLWRDFTLRRIESRFPRFKGLNVAQAFRATVLVRAVPGVPYFLQNYILAVLDVPFGIYLACSALIQSSFMIAVLLTINGGIEQDPRLALAGVLLLSILLYILRSTLPRENTRTGNVV